MTKAIMLQGTGSNVGKTILVAGLCRIAYNRGFKVAPFKPQNMSNNSCVTDEGGELARSQWLQAFAAKIPPSVHMNPILLKPENDVGSQLIIQGNFLKYVKGYNYQKIKKNLMEKVIQSYQEVQKKADLIFVEGSGATSEINLRENDIANMGFATSAKIPVILVGDIDRGGVIAAIVGTYSILQKKDRNMIVGYLINKFRGDQKLFENGISIIKSFTGWSSLGIVPWLQDVNILPEEDSHILNYYNISPSSGKIKISIPIASRISNFDDLTPLEMEKDVDLRFIKQGQSIPKSDLIFLSGSTSTISDMQKFHDCGWSDQIKNYADRGGRILGICGGFQMLGKSIQDPFSKQEKKQINGLGLLDVTTVMKKRKTLRNVIGYSSIFHEKIHGYEIHFGSTQGSDCMRSPIFVEGIPYGASSIDGKIWGTYLHGIFSSNGFRKKFLNTFNIFSNGESFQKKIDKALNNISFALEETINVDQILDLAL